MKKIHIGSIAAALTALLMINCGGKIEPGNTPKSEGAIVKAPVITAEVTQQPLLYEAVGTITARTASTISSKLMGTVLSVHVNEGDEVQKGDVLVTLDPRQVKAQLDRAEAATREARRAETSAASARDAANAAAQLARTTFDRYQKLFKENSASRQEFEEVESRHRQAQAALAQTEAMLQAAQSRVQQAEAAVREARVASKDATVRAPYAGRVVNKMISEGDLASPGMPFLTIEQEGLYWAELVLPERFIQEIKLGMKVKVVVDALNNLEATGTIGRIIPSADARSRSFQVKVDMPEDLDLKSGVFARVYIPIGGTGMLLIPKTAVVQEGQLTGVYVLDDAQIAHFRLVRMGKDIGDRVEVISGLQPGQRYVKSVPPTLKNGSKVEGI
ncbi:MAG: efflux RND transporter periplasmic adaptor subunit [Desulfosarcinaceae bacterium]